MVHPFLPNFAVASALCSVALLAPTSEAHQVLLLPMPTYTTDDKDTRTCPIAFLEGQPGFEPKEDFNAWLTEQPQKYTSLRNFMDTAKYEVVAGADFNCGWTKADGPPQPIPDGTIRSTGYTHKGPCETWIDGKLVLQEKDCHDTLTGKTNPLDYSSCGDSCMLRWYWLAVRFVKNKYSWQVYKACVPLKAGNSTSS